MTRKCQNYKFKVFGSKIYHTSANLTFGRREKDSWVQKATGGGGGGGGRQKAVRGAKKRSDILFFETIKLL